VAGVVKPIPKPSIRDVFESYGSTVHSGFGWVKATCVLHPDRNPSASLNDEICRWRCFSCGESGDAVDLVVAVEGVDLRDAIDIINQRFGGETDERQRSASSLRPNTSRSGRRNWSPPWANL
jgi:DNA primase